MAECAAVFEYMMEISKGMPSVVQQLNNKANGWKLSAYFYIANGSNGNQQRHVKEIVENITSAKKTEYLARVESSGEKAIQEIQSEFDSECLPLVPMQEKVIQSLRQGISKDK